MTVSALLNEVVTSLNKLWDFYVFPGKQNWSYFNFSVLSYVLGAGDSLGVGG